MHLPPGANARIGSGAQTLPMEAWQRMGQSGIPAIDALFDGSGDPPSLAQGTKDSEAVGALQDLLIGHGARLPGIFEAGRGSFGPKTTAAVMAFQDDHGLPVTGEVDVVTLKRLVRERAGWPVASQAYLTLVLEIPWSGFARLVALTAQFESSGRFTARNRNTDRAGLSFGIIQWAQKPGRLDGLLRAFERAQPGPFVDVLGGGNEAAAKGLLRHTSLPNGGVNSLGQSVSPVFDLVNDQWSERFIEAGSDPVWQRTQIAEAISAFRTSASAIRAVAPVARSERAFAFLLDVANQHGNGGMRNICIKCSHPNQSEGEFLLAVEEESVRRLQVQFGEKSAEAESTARRRKRFRTHALLSDVVLEEA